MSKKVGIPFTKENASEMGRKGGLASVKVRRHKKELKELINIWLEATQEKGDVYEVDNVSSLEESRGKNLRMNALITRNLIAKAASGDLMAINMLYEISGEKKKNEEINQLEPIELDFSELDELEELERLRKENQRLKKKLNEN